jgi:hypothetical protein
MPARASTSISPLTSELSSISVSSRIPSTAAVPWIFGRAWPAFQILREITDGFSEERKLGQGAFGVIYRVSLGHNFSSWSMDKYILNKSGQHNASALKQYMVLLHTVKQQI